MAVLPRALTAVPGAGTGALLALLLRLLGAGAGASACRPGAGARASRPAGCCAGARLLPDTVGAGAGPSWGRAGVLGAGAGALAGTRARPAARTDSRQWTALLLQVALPQLDCILAPLLPGIIMCAGAGMHGQEGAQARHLPGWHQKMCRVHLHSVHCMPEQGSWWEDCAGQGSRQGRSEQHTPARPAAAGMGASAPAAKRVGPSATLGPGALPRLGMGRMVGPAAGEACEGATAWP